MGRGTRSICVVRDLLLSVHVNRQMAVLGGCLALAACGGKDRHAKFSSTVESPVFSIDPTTHPAASASLVQAGGRIFARQCAPCHGATGAGDGMAAYLLYPKPRNFRKGPFRFVSTWEGVPTDDDLFRTISRG